MSTNVALTIWGPTSGLGKYTVSTQAFLVDPTDMTVNIVDPVSVTNFITDTGVTLSDGPATIWTEDDSK